MARWSTGGKSAWPRHVRLASVTIARAAAVAGRVAALAAAVAAAGHVAAVTEIETEVEIAARVATTDKQKTVAPVKKPALLFFSLSLLLCYFTFAASRGSFCFTGSGSFGQLADPCQ
jgi:hypothetical protein